MVQQGLEGGGGEEGRGFCVCKEGEEEEEERERGRKDFWKSVACPVDREINFLLFPSSSALLLLFLPKK